MRKSISALSASLLLMGLAVVPAAEAFTISLVPQTTEVGVGETVSVDVVASGLIDGAAPSLAVYDLFVSYDASLLSVLNVSFGTGLDFAGVGLGQSTLDAPGLLGVYEASFESTADLNALQPDAFTLFTITFSADAVGTSLLGLVLNGPQSSAEGTALSVDALNGASVSAVTPVPLPAAAWLLLSGLAGVGCFSRKGRRAA